MGMNFMQYLCKSWNGLKVPAWYAYFLYKKIRMLASSENFLKVSDFEYLEFLRSFSKVL